MKKYAIAFLFILLTATSVRATATSARPEMISVTGELVNMRSGPGTQHPVLWELGYGFPLKIIERRKNWVRVQDFEGDTGWVFKKFTSQTPTVIVIKKVVNIRFGPSTKEPVLGTAEYGTIFKLLEVSRGWVKIQYQDDIVGWIKDNLLWGW